MRPNNLLNPPRPMDGKRCACTAKVLLRGSVSLSTGTCFSCRTKERETMRPGDLLRIGRELGVRASELRREGYGPAADDWEMEARIVTRQARRIAAEAEVARE